MRSHSYATTGIWCLLGIGVLWGGGARAVALDFAGPSPGKAAAENRDGLLCLENNVLRMAWQISGGSLRPAILEDKMARKTLALEKAECFQLILAKTPLPGTRTIRASDLKIVAGPQLQSLQANQRSLRLADRQPGRAIVVRLVSADGALDVTWQAELRDGSNYLRQRISCQPKRKEIELTEVVVWDLAVPGAEVCGIVDGSPVVAGNWFFAAEHPMSKSRLVDKASRPGQPRFACSYPVGKSLRPGHLRQFRALVGVVPEGQLRRGFLYYLERERAQPYRPFLHYNNGSEIGCEYWSHKLFGKPGEAEAFRRGQQELWLWAIDAFGRELVNRRHVVVDSFVHDHEWDDQDLVWQFHEGYPDGFRPAQEAAARYGSHVGVWLSPFGGYAAHGARMESGRKQGFETSRLGLTLAGPRYFARFSAACQGLVDQYGVNYFKFDGFGAGNQQPGALDCASDVEALLELIGRLRDKKPDLFINPSTGSWPSPFWLLYADSIWRQGSDTELGGKGSLRQKWTTYRDGLILSGTLARGPLFPVNSLMIHGIYINHLPLSGNPYDPKSPRPTYDEKEMIGEIRSFFATGVNLQELYIAPDLMTPRTWDVLAEAARWSRRNAGVLVDTHHIGGNPVAGEIYGWASWTPAKAILALRNPDDRPATIRLDVARAWELPAGAAARYVLKSRWAEDASQPGVEVRSGQPHAFQLQPYEVRVLEATPVK
ncbi:MAG: hypothetical protein ACLQNE_06130 [Thermoguttaceae bacterium]